MQAQRILSVLSKGQPLARKGLSHGRIFGSRRFPQFISRLNVASTSHPHKHVSCLKFFSTTNPETQQSSQTTGEKGSKESKTTSDFFFDNLGKMFLALMASAILALIRSSMATTNQTNARIEVEETAAIDPLEIDDLRAANSPDFNAELFRCVMETVRQTFPSGRATYEDFASVVRNEIKKIKGESFSIQLGHFLDRVAISLLESDVLKHKANINQGGFVTDVKTEEISLIKEETNENDKHLPIDLLFTLLSLCLSDTVDNRIGIMFHSLLQNIQDSDVDTFLNENDVTKKRGFLSESEIVDMIGYLQLTCQLPPSPQILLTEVKYPVQTYARGTPTQLMANAKKELNIGGEDYKYSKDDFESILKSSHVCAWGECYNRRKKIIKKDVS